MKLPKDYKGYEFAAPPDAGVKGMPEFSMITAFPKGTKVWHCVYDVDDKKSYRDAVRWTKEAIDDEAQLHPMV